MRIISGEAKGRNLKTPGGKGTRPTDSRAREMLFNILGEKVVDTNFLDLYAGSGAVGLEALSRGAESCVFVEQNAAACAAIRDNLKMLGWQNRAQVWHSSVQSSLSQLLKHGTKFEIVFADPPFILPHELDNFSLRMDNARELLHNLNEPENQSEDLREDLREALLIVQHSHRVVFVLQHFQLLQSRRAGESALSFFGVAAEN